MIETPTSPLRFTVTRLVIVGGALFLLMGAAWLLPIAAQWWWGVGFSGTALRSVWVGPALIVCGLALLGWGRRGPAGERMPPSVRLAIIGNVLLLAFCALEFSDGLVRQDGRVFYWTSVLFLPALVILYGLVVGRRWAWWVARVLTALCAVWFLGFIAVVPFADLRADGVPMPARGRAWMIGVTLVFLTVSIYVFRVLGQPRSRSYFGVLRAGSGSLASSK